MLFNDSTNLQQLVHCQTLKFTEMLQAKNSLQFTDFLAMLHILILYELRILHYTELINPQLFRKETSYMNFNIVCIDIIYLNAGLLATLRQNHVPQFLVRKLFQQLFSFVNVQLFNQLLLRRECCSFSNGEYVKTGLAEVEQWIHSAGGAWVGESWDELRYIRQVCARFY